MPPIFDITLQVLFGIIKRCLEDASTLRTVEKRYRSEVNENRCGLEEMSLRKALIRRDVNQKRRHLEEMSFRRDADWKGNARDAR